MALENDRSSTNVALALAVSAGLHLIAMLTLDLGPGSWRHGLEPGLRVRLKSAPPILPSAPRRSQIVEARPSQPVGKNRQTETSARMAPAGRRGASLPIRERYYRQNEVDEHAIPVRRPPLVIPEIAYLSRVRGTVKARIFISEQGAVDSVEIVAVTPREGLFEQAATEALTQMRYLPARLSGHAVKSQKVVEVTFNPYDDVTAR